MDKEKTCIIGENVKIGENVTFGHNVIIEDDVTIGDNSYIDCKLRSNGMPVPLLRNCYSIFNGTKYR